jgi:hypothetical protein
VNKTGLALWYSQPLRCVVSCSKLHTLYEFLYCVYSSAVVEDLIMEASADTEQHELSALSPRHGDAAASVSTDDESERKV